MRQIFYIVMMLLTALMVGCNKDDATVGEVDLGYLKVLSSDVNFGYLGGTGTIVIDTKSNVQYELDESGAEWCTVSAEGSIVTVTVPEHTGIESRHTFITLSADGREVEINISQTTFHLMVDGGSLAINCLSSESPLAGQRSITYTPIDLSGISATKDVDWIKSVKAEMGTVTIDVQENRGVSREGVVTIMAGEQDWEISVTQEAAAIVTSPASISFVGANREVVISFDIPGGAGLTSATPVADWCTITNIDNAEKTITISATRYTNPLPRETTITLVSGSITTTINVTQRG